MKCCSESRKMAENKGNENFSGFSPITRLRRASGGNSCRQRTAWHARKSQDSLAKLLPSLCIP